MSSCRDIDTTLAQDGRGVVHLSRLESRLGLSSAENLVAHACCSWEF
jgi:hypothetical protein